MMELLLGGIVVVSIYKLTQAPSPSDHPTEMIPPDDPLYAPKRNAVHGDIPRRPSTFVPRSLSSRSPTLMIPTPSDEVILLEQALRAHERSAIKGSPLEVYQRWLNANRE